MQDYLFRIWPSQQDSFRWRHKLYFRKVGELQQLSIHHAVSSSYNQKDNGQQKHVLILWREQWKNTVKLMLARSTPISPGLPNPATLQLNRLARRLLLRFSRPSIMYDSGEINFAVLKTDNPNQWNRYINISLCLQDQL